MARYVLCVSLALGGCAGGGGGGGECRGGKCDGAGDFTDELEGRSDPIARYLRTLTPDEDGLLELDFGEVARGVAEIQGCSVESWKTFVVSDPLVEGAPFPRLVSTVCSDNLSKAAEFFLAASFKHPEREDVDGRELEMFAWDEDARKYRFYATARQGDGRVDLEVDPTRCRDCHLTPTNLPSETMRMTPIMNELTRPWSHWNSTLPMFASDPNPFPSHDFVVPEEVREGENFVSYGRDRAGVAQELEAVIRAGHSKVVTARLRDRRERPGDDWRPAMNLLRPLFCGEQVNYSTEDFDSGKIEAHALVPGGAAVMFDKISKREERDFSNSWEWFHTDSGKLKLPVPDQVGPLPMIPVRGSADIAYESQLVEVRNLSARQVLQIRALDWKRPVFSEFRCGLWRDALARFEAEPPEINPNDRNYKRMQALYGEIMKLGGAPISAEGEDRLVTLDRATEESVAALEGALAGGTLEEASCGEQGAGFCALSLDEWGDAMQAYVATFTQGQADEVRERLRALRDERLCHVQDFFQNAPALPPVECTSPEDTGSGEGQSYATVQAEPVEIPDADPAGAESDVDCPVEGLSVESVQVNLDIRHSWRGDVTVSLIPPDGEPREVVSFDDLDSTDHVQGRFDVASVEVGTAAHGLWTLRVVDGAEADTGTLESWSIGINEPAPDLPTSD